MVGFDPHYGDGRISETSVFNSTLAWLIDPNDFSTLTRRESFKP
jgi:hypothetical protein